MRAGDLDRRITLQSATLTRDAMNNPTRTWADVATVWASRLDVSDGERIAAKQVGAEIGTRFVIRHSETVEDVNPTWRLTSDGVTYEIVAVKEVKKMQGDRGRKRGFEITAVARADDG